MAYFVSAWEIYFRLCMEEKTACQKPTALNVKQLQLKLTLACIRDASRWNGHKHNGTLDEQFIVENLSIVLT